MKQDHDVATGTSTATMRSGRKRHGRIRVFRLVVIGGVDAGEELVSRGDRVIVGTHRTADLKLADKTVSRFHCEIEIQGQELLVRDLGSHNGTVVDSVSVLAARLRSGAILQLGDTRLRCDVGIDSVEVSLSERDRFGVLVGGSVRMRALYAMLEAAAASDITVLVEGETGTGKEALAESLHQESARRDRPFCVVDCGAIPAELLESELLGHEQGAFTGAASARPGVFEEADGGTVFLDEIGELALRLQPVLLRVLEQREVKRVGGNRRKKVDIRIVAATHRDLRSEVNARRFRSDLYYRLAVLSVRLPALRDRLEDLPLLVADLLASLGASERPEVALLQSSEFFAELAAHAWPGNVRELRNYLERCLALRRVEPPREGETPATPADVATLCDSTQPLKKARDRWNRVMEQGYLKELVAAHDGNIAAAARSAGIDRAYLYRLLWRHGMR